MSDSRLQRARLTASLNIGGDRLEHSRTPPAKQLPDGEAIDQQALIGVASNFSLGTLKLIPAVGNALNLLSLAADLERLVQLHRDPDASTADEVLQGAAAVCHAAGVVVPMVGALYDFASCSVTSGNLAVGAVEEMAGQRDAIDRSAAMIPSSLRSNALVSALMNRLELGQ